MSRKYDFKISPTEDVSLACNTSCYVLSCDCWEIYLSVALKIATKNSVVNFNSFLLSFEIVLVKISPFTA